MKIGAHVSAAGPNLHTVLKEVKGLGMTAAQIFSGSPQRYAVKFFDPSVVEQCKQETQDFPLFLHLAYTANPATADGHLSDVIAQYILKCDDLAFRLGAVGCVIHTGSFGEGSTREEGISRIRGLLSKIHDKLKTKLIFENVAGLGTSIGRTAQDMMAVVGGFDKAVVCWDTCHAFAQGVDITKVEVVRQVIETLGLKLALIHLNGWPAKVVLGSHLDRHNLITKTPEWNVGLAKEWLKAGVPLIIEDDAVGLDLSYDVRFMLGLEKNESVMAATV